MAHSRRSFLGQVLQFGAGGILGLSSLLTAARARADAPDGGSVKSPPMEDDVAAKYGVRDDLAEKYGVRRPPPVAKYGVRPPPREPPVAKYGVREDEPLPPKPEAK